MTEPAQTPRFALRCKLIDGDVAAGRARPPEAKEIATAAGLDYVEDGCTAIVHRRL